MTKTSKKEKQKQLSEKSPMNLEEFCLRANISKSTARRLIIAGDIGYLRIGKRLYVTEAQFLEFMERHSIPAT